MAWSERLRGLQARAPWGVEVLACVLLTIVVWPLWATSWVPLQDLPQHLAAIRVLGDWGDPALNFAQTFVRTPWETQYIGFYGLVLAFKPLMGLDAAWRFVLSGVVFGIFYSARALLVQMRRPQWLALWTLPLCYNATLGLGFLNFLAAVPLMFYGLALCAAQQREARPWRGVQLGGVMLGCYFMHVVPFALLSAGCVMMWFRRQQGVRGFVVRAWPVVVAVAVAGVWSVASRAGGSLGGIVASTWRHLWGGQTPDTVFAPWGQGLRQLPDWTLDMVTHPAEDWVVVGYLVVALCMGWAARPLATVPRSRLRHVVWVLAIGCGLAYFLLPQGHTWVWPIAPRFAVLGLWFGVLLGPEVAPRARGACVAALCGLIVGHAVVIAGAFERFEEEEAVGFDQVIAQLPLGSKTAGLVFDGGSAHVRFVPFIHAAAMAQAERGGAVMFTFADFAQSPFRFREDHRPPRVPPRWEWGAGHVNPQNDLSWYDHVLVRGGPGRIAQTPSFGLVAHHGAWSLWRRIR